MVIPSLVRQALSATPLTVFGDGTQTRCFAHVADVIDALLRLLDEDAAIGQTFNIGSTDEVSILELAKLIIGFTGSTSGIDLIPYSEAYEQGFEDMTRRVPDTTKLRELTGWVPRRTLDEILTEIIREASGEPAASAR
jgi:UDP-glucose 4-epimerase